MKRVITLIMLAGALLPGLSLAAEGGSFAFDLTHHPIGYSALLIFALAYALVMAEEFTHLRKSKPVLLAAGILWALVAIYYAEHGDSELVTTAVRHNIMEYAELLLFLLVAMTYINAMDERQVFDALRSWLVRQGYGFRKLFWITGFLAFFISPVADNLTTALLMCAVLMSVGKGHPRFIGLGCVNIVIAANAGGAFSPFGDITTLMVWQKGIIEFREFFNLFIPALLNFVVPAIFMSLAVPHECPVAEQQATHVKRGGRRIVLLFLATIMTAVMFNSLLALPPMMGMMTGLAYLQLFGYYLKKTPQRDRLHHQRRAGTANHAEDAFGSPVTFDVFRHVARAEWDTLLFFYGVVLCVGALGFMGYLSLASEVMYHNWGATTANVMVGVLSAVIDNIPVMFAVLSMGPDMSHGQWLLVTLTAGVGGSLLSIGSAAGVALMGQARGYYTFFLHLKWTPVIALGYAVSILAHMWLNASLF